MFQTGEYAGEVISEAYELEYGTDCLEMHVGAVEPGERAIVIDDLVATGGTLSAAIRLLERSEAEVVECACVIGLREVKGQCRLNGKPLYILVEPRQIENCCWVQVFEYEYAQAQADVAAKKDDGWADGDDLLIRFSAKFMLPAAGHAPHSGFPVSFFS